MTKIIIGVDDSDRSADAVALGAQLAEGAGGTDAHLDEWFGVLAGAGATA